MAPKCAPYKTPITWEESSRELFVREGGYVNDKNDSGGRTNMGITEDTYKRFHKLKRRPTEEEMRNLSPAVAAEIYFQWYWQAPRFDDLHPAIRYVVFDMGVHAGPAVAARLLQKCVNVECEGWGLPRIATDGHIGDITIQRVKDVIKCGHVNDINKNTGGKNLCNEFCLARRGKLFSLANRYKKNRAYFFNKKEQTKAGWCIRPEKDMSKSKWLSIHDLQFMTDKWAA